MEKFENIGNRFFESTEAMISSVLENEENIAVCPGQVEVDEKEKWSVGTVVLFIVVIVICLILSASGIDPEFVSFLIVAPFGIYAFMKGFRSRPDALVITTPHVWLFHNVTFNKREKAFSYIEVFKIPRTEIKKLFAFGSTVMRFKVPGKLKVAFRQKRSENIEKYYKRKSISVKEAKKILFKS